MERGEGVDGVRDILVGKKRKVGRRRCNMSRLMRLFGGRKRGRCRRGRNIIVARGELGEKRACGGGGRRRATDGGLESSSEGGLESITTLRTRFLEDAEGWAAMFWLVDDEGLASLCSKSSSSSSSQSINWVMGSVRFNEERSLAILFMILATGIVSRTDWPAFFSARKLVWITLTRSAGFFEG